MGSASIDPMAMMREFLRETGGCAVMDGGLATELEANGADLKDPLWSSKCLFTCPDLVKKVHLNFIEAGANIVITASYQATIQGFQSRGFSREESEALLKRSVDIALEAKEIFLKKCSETSCNVIENQIATRKHPILIAASVGCYGAYLADGSEYIGDYGKDVTLDVLKDFHRRRLEVLSEAGPDLIAFETIPNKLEAQAYVELLEECHIDIPAWLSFSSKDGINVVSGDTLIECASIADSCKNIVAVGVNCTPPEIVQTSILSLRKATNKPILVYPNSGETYDAERKEWLVSSVQEEDFVPSVTKWHQAGASLIGGCCRTTPSTIRAISRTLQESNVPRADQDHRHAIDNLSNPA